MSLSTPSPAWEQVKRFAPVTGLMTQHPMGEWCYRPALLAARAADASHIAQMRSELKDAHQLYDEGKVQVAALSAQVEQQKEALFAEALALRFKTVEVEQLNATVEQLTQENKTVNQVLDETERNYRWRVEQLEAELVQLRQEKA